jgi:hypothetical protein
MSSSASFVGSVGRVDHAGQTKSKTDQTQVLSNISVSPDPVWDLNPMSNPDPLEGTSTMYTPVDLLSESRLAQRLNAPKQARSSVSEELIDVESIGIEEEDEEDDIVAKRSKI